MLEEIEVLEFTKLLDEALKIVNAKNGRTSENPQAMEAIKVRLQFRLKFLQIVSYTPSSRKGRRSALESCKTLLLKITASMNLGKEIPQAFSTRIQRKLSIQVPPRPMVSIDPMEAVTSLEVMLDSLLEIEAINDYESPHEIIVLFPLIGLILELFRLLCH